jgi:hypothetical protein
VCYHIGGDLHEPALRQAARAEAAKDARALARYPKHPKALNDRWECLKEIGQDADGVADLKRLCYELKELNGAYYYGQYLYKRGDFAQAVNAFEQCKGQHIVDLLRVMAVTELPDGPAQAAKLHEEIAGRDLGDWDLFNSQLILRFLGRNEDAVMVSKKFLTQPEKFPPIGREPFRRALEYCAGERNAEELIASMGGLRGDLVNAYLCIGLTALGEGNLAYAREYLELCEGTHHFERVPYDVAQMVLSRMNDDPKWPPWIKAAR